MKHTNSLTLRIISLILVLITLALFCSCNTNNEPLGEPTDAITDKETEKATEGKKEYNDGKLRIFADGHYYCDIVRPEGATGNELALYTSIRNLFKEITGVMPPMASDFLGSGESYDSGKFEILIGETKHTESKKHYDSLDYSEFSAQLIDKKYVIGFHDMTTAEAALNKLRSLLVNNFKNGELILDETWSYSYSENEVLESFPKYDGGSFDNVYGGAYGMQTVVIKNTNADEYKAYLDKITTEGFSYYTDNTIGNNLFATYQNEKYYMSAMYFANINEVRLTLEYTGNYSLPSLKGENVYTSKGIAASITQIGLEESGQIQNGMSYVIKLDDGSFIVIDGGTGTAGTKKQFVEVLQSLSDDPEHLHIAAWIITHAHGDHMGLIFTVLYDEQYAGLFEVNQIIWSKVSEEQLKNIGGGNMDYVDKAFAKLEGTKIVIAHPGQVFYIRNAVYTVYTTIEMVEPLVLDNLNDSSVVGMLEIEGKAILFPGDSHPTETGVIISVFGEALKADAVQIIHHGYQGGSDAFYSLVDPLTVFWPLGMKNYSTAEAPNTPMKDWSFSRWIFSDSSKVENIYVAGSEVLTLPISELPSHTAE